MVKHDVAPSSLCLPLTGSVAKVGGGWAATYEDEYCYEGWLRHSRKDRHNCHKLEDYDHVWS